MQRLSGLDAGFLYMETPSLHMHTLKVAVLDQPAGAPLSSAELLDRIGAHLAGIPPFRRRLVEVPFGFHHPVWIEDPDFDLDYHVRRVRLPAPGDRGQLDAAVADIAGVPLDRRRPLWRMHVFDGLEDGRLAVLVKIHHAVADGSAASALLANVMSPSADEDAVPTDRWRPEHVPSRRRLLADALRDHLRQLGDLPGLVAATLSRIRAMVRQRRRSSVRTPLPVVSTPATPFNRALTPRRAFATASLPLSEAARIRAAFGVTLNDVVLATVAGSLRAHLLARDALPGAPLVAGVPVSADDVDDRLEGNRLGGNRVSNLFTSLATDEADPVDRLERIHAVTAEAKRLHGLMGAETFGAWVQYTPPRPYAWFVRQYSRLRIADRHPPPINVVVSNVPGPREPLYAAGVRLRELYSVGPVLEGIGLNVTVWSYLDRLYVGVLSCPDQLPAPQDIASGMRDALDELVARATATPQDAVVASNT